MKEIPFFFPNGRYNLFGVFHKPDTPRIDSCIVLCHAFGEEKLWSHRVFVNFSREAARRNVAVLRFDFMGHGDSDGHSEQATIDTCLSDIDAALREAQHLCPNLTSLGLLGARFGGTLAILFATARKLSAPIMLWEPILNGAKYMQELLRINLSTQLATLGYIEKSRSQLVENMHAGILANVDGYLVSGTYYDECCSIDLLSPNIVLSSSGLLTVQIARNSSQQDRPELLELSKRSENGRFLRIETPAFWKEIRPFCSSADTLNDKTLEWWIQQNGN